MIAVHYKFPNDPTDRFFRIHPLNAHETEEECLKRAERYAALISNESVTYTAKRHHNLLRYSRLPK